MLRRAIADIDYVLNVPQRKYEIGLFQMYVSLH